MSHNEVFSRDGDLLTETLHNREWLPNFLDNPADALSTPSSVDSRDSGYESLNFPISDTVESVRGKKTTGTNR